MTAYKGRIFAVTAAHLIKELNSEDVLIFPTTTSKALALSNGYRTGIPSPDQPADFDVIIYEAYMQNMSETEADNARAIKLDVAGSYSWMDSSYVAQFFLCGYPSDKNGIDYERMVAESNQYLLPGQYVGAFNQATVHTLKVDNPLAIGDFSGLSGSPVFSIEHRLASASVTRFCGIATNGGAGAGMVHFLEARTILDMMDTILESMQERSWSSNFVRRPEIIGTVDPADT